METAVYAKSTRNEKVLNCLYQKPDAVFKLICFPWAGGGSIHFAKWGQKINGLLEVHAVRLAGRETRLEEPFSDDIYQIAEEIVTALLPIIRDKAFAFFGHSLGSYIAFVTALHLKEKYKMEPLHIFLSSAPAPQSRPQVPDLNKLSEEQVRDHLLIFGGTPKHLIEDQDFLKQYIPLLKADAHIVKKFIFNKPSKALLSRDITCFIGSEDTIKDIEDNVVYFSGWKDITSGKFDVHKLPGDHFYLMEPDNENFIKNYIAKCLELSSLDCF
ncbi:S-acyl fatty acid synthase thioesterase, medium chain isoform X1 [Mastomys coucha]|uniref:S-acyl fatty acid synthase thioesterase, medium chain isoform X1 n=1 Tax=Mastomys coucha TaxID=35658 RepID=UPI001261D4CE|nr:S-acyl fatty acid synthase thioesterase, medium chain isoform X1 [Mastomys coucha]XP_031215022.1 S-acyl fatty acid synthase thioesterase, medium chain isoform X1 [Mastomys coucha]XP_031215023.1 S-acyl fatty acid synthase thioesterase, medium chain isoform X1 [Mastomys coucha]